MTNHLVLEVVFIVLMVLWLGAGWYVGTPAGAPYASRANLVAWICVAILGWLVFHG
jgi:hypothetical protein